MYPNYFLTKWPLIFKNNSTLLQSKEKNVWLTALQDQNLKKIRKCNQNYNLLRHDAYFTWIVSSEGKYSFTNNAFFFTWLQTSSQKNKSNNKERFNWVIRKLSFPGKHCRFKEKRRLLFNSYRNQKPQWYIKPGQVLGKMKNIFESANCMTFFYLCFQRISKFESEEKQQ